MWRELVASSRVAGAFPYLGGLPAADAPKPELWRRRVEPAPANHFDSKRNAESRQGKPGRCRCKVRMSGLRKVGMSAFMGGRGPHGNGAHSIESTRTGPLESVAGRGAGAFNAGGSGRTDTFV